MINIKTKLPHPADLALIKELKQYEPMSMTDQLPIVWQKAHNCMVEDNHGNSFLDFTSTICVSNVGHGHSDVCNALRKQLAKPLLHSYDYATRIRLKYIKALTEFTGFEQVFLLSTGAEAVEAAVKIMRINGLKQNIDKNYIISIKDSMHGKTHITESLKDDSFWTGSGYVNKIYRLDYFANEDQTFEKALRNLEIDTSLIAGFIIEGYQGWSARFYSTKFIKDLVSFAHSNNSLVCFDEIQSGWGRTGRLFAYEHYHIKPDLICCGKGIGSGMQLSCVLGKAKLFKHVKDLSSTHSGHPLSCAAGLATIHIFKGENFFSRDKIAFFKSNIKTLVKRFPLFIQDYHGKGYVFALITPTKELATKIVFDCFKRGLLLIWTHKNSIKIAPPISIKKNEIKEGIDVIYQVLKSYEQPT